jgi:hypothetical protein
MMSSTLGGDASLRPATTSSIAAAALPTQPVTTPHPSTAAASLTRAPTLITSQQTRHLPTMTLRENPPVSTASSTTADTDPTPSTRIATTAPPPTSVIDFLHRDVNDLARRLTSTVSKFTSDITSSDDRLSSCAQKLEALHAQFHAIPQVLTGLSQQLERNQAALRQHQHKFPRPTGAWIAEPNCIPGTPAPAVRGIRQPEALAATPPRADVPVHHRQAQSHTMQPANSFTDSSCDHGWYSLRPFTGIGTVQYDYDDHVSDTESAYNTESELDWADEASSSGRDSSRLSIHDSDGVSDTAHGTFDAELHSPRYSDSTRDPAVASDNGDYIDSNDDYDWSDSPVEDANDFEVDHSGLSQEARDCFRDSEVAHDRDISGSDSTLFSDVISHHDDSHLDSFCDDPTNPWRCYESLFNDSWPAGSSNCSCYQASLTNTNVDLIEEHL